MTQFGRTTLWAVDMPERGPSGHPDLSRAPMIGRDAELAEIAAAAAEVAKRGRALVVEGEAGIGKTTLLDGAAETLGGQGFLVLSCAGVQCQRSVGYAAIHELVHPILGYADALPQHQRTALLAAFGLAEHAMPDRLLIGVAMLGLIEEAAAHQPLLLIVDDAQWLDGSSLHVLTFVGRRLMNAPVMLLCAARPRPDGEPARLVSLTRFPMGPLDEASARRLLANALTTDAGERKLAELVERRILTEARGNPLAITELAKAVVACGGDDPVFAAAPLPTTRRIERVFLEQLDTVDEPSRHWLALISAAADAPAAEVVAAAHRVGLDEEDLDPLERSGLIMLSDGRFHVRHPLLRSVAYRAAALSQRSSIHRALADVAGDPVRTAWQHSAATYGPDEEVAAELEAAAQRALRHGANPEATAAFRRAAVLSPLLEHRVRRLVQAIEPASRAGLTLEAIDILDEAEPLARDLGDLNHLCNLALARFTMGMTSGIGAASVRDLVALADRVTEDGPNRTRLLTAAAAQCRMHDLPNDDRGEVMLRLAPLAEPADGTVAIALALIDDLAHARRFRASVPANRSRVGGDAIALTAMGLAAESVCDAPTARACWDAALRVARAEGSPAWECEALRGQAQSHILAGQLREATVSAQAALQIATETNLTLSAGIAAALQARAQVWRGETSLARQSLAEARRHLTAEAPQPWLDELAWAAGLLALSTHDHQDALTELTKLTRNGSARRWAVADLTEAAVASRHTEVITPLVEEIALAANTLGSEALAMLVHRSRALLADQDHAEAHFRAALGDAVGAVAAPLEFARTQLCYGEWLRRQRRIVDARAQLSHALRTFESTGALPWAQRTRAELRAAGVQLPGQVAERDAAAELTPQELEIARLAASGMSNRQIADRIYVSHRTVAAHLYKVFPKLGITSRNQLRDALADTIAGAPQR